MRKLTILLVFIAMSTCLVSCASPDDTLGDGTVAIVNSSTSEETVYEGQFCGGVVIASMRVATVSHCIDQRSVDTIKVAYGAKNVCGGGWKFVKVEQIEVVNGVALLDLAGPIPRPAEVAGLREDLDMTAFGWGRYDRGSEYACELKSIQLAAVVDDECLSLKYSDSVAPLFCARPAAASRANTCTGDSGGPVFQHQGRRVVVGLVEGGIGCGSSDDGVYVRISDALGSD